MLYSWCHRLHIIFCVTYISMYEIHIRGGIDPYFFKPKRNRPKNFQIEPDRTDLLFTKSQTEPNRVDLNFQKFWTESIPPLMCVVVWKNMASSHERLENMHYTTFASKISARRPINPTSSNEPTEQIIVLKSDKPKKPLDYLIWSTLLVVSGMLILGFVSTILLIAAYKGMWNKTIKNAVIHWNELFFFQNQV